MSATLDRIKHAKSQLDIVEVIGRYVPGLKKHGTTYFGKSPFTSERTGSFTVNPVKNIFKCFSSGKGGDVLDFIIEAEKIKGNNITYKQAVDIATNGKCEIPKNYIYIPPPPIIPDYHPIELVKSTQKKYDQNNFFIWLASLFGVRSLQAVSMYNLGTSKHYNNACIFWYQDKLNRVHGGKIMGYNPENGKRVKEQYLQMNWVHKILAIKNPLYSHNYKACFFGEHLIDLSKEVHVVESEKTAIVASLCYPEHIWVATGANTNLTYENCNVAFEPGQVVVLHPDVGLTVGNWIDKCSQLKELLPLIDWRVQELESDQKGYDFCDWIIDNLI